MKTPLIAITILTVLLVSVTLSANALAEKSGKEEVKSIMTAYQKAIHKAQSDFKAAIEKANSDARAAISKNIPTDQINTESKAAITKARADLKAAKDLAQKEAKNSLAKLKATIQP
jgi:Skp family chaperone for outer membrane proteins